MSKQVIPNYMSNMIISSVFIYVIAGGNTDYPKVVWLKWIELCLFNELSIIKNFEDFS